MLSKRTAVTITIASFLIVVVLGLVLANIPYTYEVCAGDVVSTDLCEPARLGRTIFGAALTVGGLISVGTVVAAFMISRAITKRA